VLACCPSFEGSSPCLHSCCGLRSDHNLNLPKKDSATGIVLSSSLRWFLAPKALWLEHLWRPCLTSTTTHLGSNDHETGQQLESIAFRSRTYFRWLHIVDSGTAPASIILPSSLSANTSLFDSHNDEDINGSCHFGWHSGRRTTRYGLLKFTAPG
jgi:hypothetical protein